MKRTEYNRLYQRKRLAWKKENNICRDCMQLATRFGYCAKHARLFSRTSVKELEKAYHRGFYEGTLAAGAKYNQNNLLADIKEVFGE